MVSQVLHLALRSLFVFVLVASLTGNWQLCPDMAQHSTHTDLPVSMGKPSRACGAWWAQHGLCWPFQQGDSSGAWLHVQRPWNEHLIRTVWASFKQLSVSDWTLPTGETGRSTAFRHRWTKTYERVGGVSWPSEHNKGICSWTCAQPDVPPRRHLWEVSSRDPSYRTSNQCRGALVNGAFFFFKKTALKPVSKLLEESFGIKFSEYFAYYDSMPKGVKTGDRQSWISVCRNMEGFYIHPVGFELLTKQKNTSATRWRVLKVLFSGQYFDSVADLKQQYDAGTVEKVEYRPVLNYASLRPERKPTGIGPQQCYARGKRCSIKNNHVVYLDWSFAFGLSPRRGMRVFRCAVQRRENCLRVKRSGSYVRLRFCHSKSHAHQVSGWQLGHRPQCLRVGQGCGRPSTPSTSWTPVSRPKSKTPSVSLSTTWAVHSARHFSNILFHRYGGLSNSALVFRTINNDRKLRRLVGFRLLPERLCERRSARHRIHRLLRHAKGQQSVWSSGGKKCHGEHPHSISLTSKWILTF